MLIAEELFLLLRRDDGKPESAMAQNGYGLAGAAIGELILAERVTVSEDKDPRLSVTDPSPTGNQVLDPALQTLTENEGKKVSGLVTKRALNPERRVVASLAEQGVIRIEEKRALGLVPERYPVLDEAPENAVRERLRTVLTGGTARPGDAVLLSILQGLDVAPKVLAEERGSLGRRELKKRIEEVSREAVVGLAVGRAVQAINTAMMTAVIIPAVTSSGGS